MCAREPQCNVALLILRLRAQGSLTEKARSSTFTTGMGLKENSLYNLLVVNNTVANNQEGRPSPLVSASCVSALT